MTASRLLDTTSRYAGDLLLVGIALTLDLAVWGGARTLRTGETLPGWTLITATAVVFLLLVLRRRWPVAVFALQVGYATALSWLIPGSDCSAGVLVGLHAVAALHPARRSARALPVSVLPLAVQQYQHGAGPDPTITGITLVVIGAAWLLGHRAWRAERSRLASEAAAEALRTERLRIARELHDIISHSVSVMMLHAAGARAVLAADPHRAEAALQVIQETGTESMTELRRLLGLLRTAGGDAVEDAGQPPGLNRLDELLRRMRRAGLVITAQTDGPTGRLDPSVSLCAYRVVQESLTNTLKHGGEGSTVRVHLDWETDSLGLTVTDRAGKRPAGGSRLDTGHGLLGLRERVGAVGGTLDAYPVDGGFVVRTTLPLSAATKGGPVPSQPEGSPR